jgi:hypothetical protein
LGWGWVGLVSQHASPLAVRNEATPPRQKFKGLATAVVCVRSA